jgi:4-amino-4-deoxy-L-arabinose transferase-like glycosyltransferase
MPNLDVDRLIQGWRGPVIAAFVAMLAGLPGLIAVPPLDRDESRFAQATAQMLETGDYVNIRFQDMPRSKKPVGIHWLQAAAVSAVSDSEAREIWAYRLPALLGAMLAAAACAWGAAAFFGARGGVIAGVTLATTFLLSTEAFIAKTDAMLTACIVVAMGALGRLYRDARGGPPAGRRIRLVFWLAMAGAVLIKGPIGPMVVAMTLLFLSIADGKPLGLGRLARKLGLGPLLDRILAVTRPEPYDAPSPTRWIKSLGWVWGVLLVLIVVGPWAIAITVATDGSFWTDAIGGDLAPKLKGGHERHGGPPGYHTLALPVMFFPGTLLLAAAAVAGWTRRMEPGVRFAVAWFIPSFILFELAPTKLPHYPLPVYAALAWLVAAALERPLGTRARWTGIGLAAFAAIALTAVNLYGMVQYGDADDVVWVSLTIGFALIGVAVAAFFLLNRAGVTALMIACVFGFLTHGVMAAGVLPNLKPMWPSRSIAKTLKAKGMDPRNGVTPGPVELVGFSEPSAVFLLGTDTGLGGPIEGAQAIAEHRPVFVEAKEEGKFRGELAARGLRAVPVSVIRAYNYSRGKPLTLTLYRSAAAGPGTRAAVR